MSSQSFRKPEFRLYLGYPEVTLTRAGASVPIGTALPDTPDFLASLRGFAAEVARARARLVVVLPADEVWRGRSVLSGRGRGARRRAATEVGADGLGMPPQAVAVVLGESARDGTTPIAAVRRGTLAQTRGLMARVGLRPASIVGGGAFPGFATPPRLAGSPWRLPTIPRPERRYLGFGAGAVAAAAAVMLALPGKEPTPVVAPTRPPAIEVAAVAEPAREAAAKPVVAPKPQLLRAAPPMPRPEGLAAVARTSSRTR
jgi:hypothetical protein